MLYEIWKQTRHVYQDEKYNFMLYQSAWFGIHKVFYNETIHIWSSLRISHSLNIVTKKRDWDSFWVWVTHDKVDEIPWWPANIFYCSHFKVTDSCPVATGRTFTTTVFRVPTQMNSNYCRAWKCFKAAIIEKNHIRELVILLARGLKHLLCTRCAMSPGLVKPVFCKSI